MELPCAVCLYLPGSANLVAVIVVQFVISQDEISYEFFVGDHRTEGERHWNS